MTPGIAPQTEVPKKFNWKVWLIPGAIIAVIILIIVGALVPSFKQTISTLETQVMVLNSVNEQSKKELDSFKQENQKLNEAVSKEKSKSKYLKEYYENGNIKREEGESSNSSEARVTQLESELVDASKEIDILNVKIKEVSNELSVALNKTTERRGDIGIVGAGVFSLDPFGVKPALGVDARLFDLFGISVRLGAFVSR